MPDDDARLTDFLPADDDAGGEPAGTVTSEEDDVTPAVSTAAWHPDGACDACGGAAERRWRDGDALVCADCREW